MLSTDEESVSEEETTHRPRKKQLRSGKLRRSDSVVLHKVTWPHELVYSASDQPVIYNDISIHLFVSGYLAIIEAERQPVRLFMAWHLQELIGDAKM